MKWFKTLFSCRNPFIGLDYEYSQYANAGERIREHIQDAEDRGDAAAAEKWREQLRRYRG